MKVNHEGKRMKMRVNREGERKCEDGGPRVEVACLEDEGVRSRASTRMEGHNGGYVPCSFRRLHGFLLSFLVNCYKSVTHSYKKKRENEDRILHANIYKRSYMST